jgi:predicted TIM-barrel fold metal-dependent hydrolase
VLPKDWLAVASPHGVRETVVVEASPLLEDNQWILDLAEKEKSIIGFVGNLDLADPAFSTRVARFSKNPIFRGIRARGGLSQFEKATDQIMKSAKSLADHGLELDLNGPASTLENARQILRAIPDLRLVINHLGSPGDPQNLKPEWKDSIRKISVEKNAFMKVSALVEQVKGEEGKAPTDTAYYLPILDHLWECFGPDRLIYGSNWPVCEWAADYATVVGIVRPWIASYGPKAQASFFHGAARTAYGLAATARCETVRVP